MTMEHQLQSSTRYSPSSQVTKHSETKGGGVRRRLHSHRYAAIAIAAILSWTYVWQQVHLHILNVERQERILEERFGYESSPKYPSLRRESISTRRLGVLMGIFTADVENDRTYRKRHRKLFFLWNDPRVCSLADFLSRSDPRKKDECELIYTFVVGANPDGPNQIVDDSMPLLAPTPPKWNGTDLNDPDVTQLNIRENMNDGKSQTWFRYAAQIAGKHKLDYVMKLDTDSILHLHEFFSFAYRHLPPRPYSSHTYVGALRDKAFWPKKNRTKKELVEYESHFGDQFEGVHLYLAGQCYILSLNLARVVANEAAEPSSLYLEGHEDHDVGTMVFHSPEPVHLVIVGRKQRFWEHPVKGEPRWRRIFSREVARMSQRPFEGKLFSTNSSYEEVLGGDESSDHI